MVVHVDARGTAPDGQPSVDNARILRMADGKIGGALAFAHRLAFDAVWTCVAPSERHRPAAVPTVAVSS